MKLATNARTQNNDLLNESLSVDSDVAIDALIIKAALEEVLSEMGETTKFALKYHMKNTYHRSLDDFQNYSSLERLDESLRLCLGLGSEIIMKHVIGKIEKLQEEADS